MENLDSLDNTELWAFWTKHVGGNHSGDLFPGMINGAMASIAATANLADYARFKAVAIEHRKGGRVALALFYEQQCDKIYEALPERARW